MSSKNNRVVRYKKRRTINIGVIIFGVTFLYLIIYIALYMTRDKISYYEVVTGKNADSSNKYYNGLVLRNEEITTVETSGYISYYLREGNRASIGSTIYTLDESGSVAELLANTDKSSAVLGEDDLSEIKSQISQFSTTYSDTNFGDVYNFKDAIDATISECVNQNAISNLDKLLSDSGNPNLFQIKKASKTGAIAYYTDGFESMTPDKVTASCFDTSAYKKNSIKSNTLIEKGGAAYKTVSSEEWYIIIQLSDEDVATHKDDTSIKIKLIDDDITLNCSFEILNLADGHYGKLTFNKYMSKYISNRYLNIKIVESSVNGLKIPKSSVIEKEFLIIPKEYATKGGDEQRIGFNKQSYNEKGELIVTFISPTIYYISDDYYYIDTSALSTNDIIIMNDSIQTFTVGSKAPLKGVYNINSGYAVFKQINILEETGDYYIVESGTSYGLIIYDHIVLDGSMISENEVVFQ